MFRQSRSRIETFLPILTRFGTIPTTPIVPAPIQLCAMHKSPLIGKLERSCLWLALESPQIFDRSMPIATEIRFSTRCVKLPKRTIEQAVAQIASDYGWEDGEISIAIVDDAQIHQVNLEYLNHDYPTDVISFDTTESESFLEGDVIASAQTAHRIATENQWPAPQELLLYIIHGMLHVIGLEDTTESQAKKMRAQEKYYLEAILGDSTVCKEAR